MDTFTIKDLAKIIERDSKDATYKFALLRGTIELIQEHDNYKVVSEKGVSFPLGLLILKWMEYYYPIFSNELFIPQKYGDSKQRTIAFRSEFKKVIDLYTTTRLADQLFYDLKIGIDNPVKIETIVRLVKKFKDTIIRQPMHYIGSAINRGGQIYTYNHDSRRYRNIDKLNLEWIIDTMGTFSIPIELFHVMQVVGSFVTGTHSIIFRWAEFTANLSKDRKISTSDMISLLKSDFNERDILQARNFYSNILSNKPLHCVWSGRTISSDLHIDHVIPFVAFRNNDLWNLLPSRNEINIRKSDKIPATEMLNDKNIKERIIYYWENLLSKFTEQFKSEVQVSLLGKIPFTPDNWKNNSYNQLISICNYMIEERGFDPWINIQKI